MSYRYTPVATVSEKSIPILSLHGSNTLVVSCSGFYLLGETYNIIHPYSPHHYDSLAIPGASAGVMNYSSWRVSFLEQMNTLVDLHSVEHIIIIDHEDCGVYNNLYGSDHGLQMFKNHAKNMIGLKNLIHKDRPYAQIDMYLVTLDGQIYQLEQ